MKKNGFLPPKTWSLSWKLLQSGTCRKKMVVKKRRYPLKSLCFPPNDVKNNPWLFDFENWKGYLSCRGCLIDKFPKVWQIYQDLIFRNLERVTKKMSRAKIVKSSAENILAVEAVLVIVIFFSISVRRYRIFSLWKSLTYTTFWGIRVSEWKWFFYSALFFFSGI